MSEDTNVPPTGPVPGKRRRRDPLPTSDESGSAAAPPNSGALGAQPEPAEAAPDGLAVTEKTTRPPAKLWGLRVSEQHHDTISGMIDTLAAHTRMDKRQVGELLIQFLVQHRLRLMQYVESHGQSNRIDLDWFTKQ